MTLANTFPENFLWGCATSAYQVEGSPLADGAGPSNWHRFTHTPGRIVGGDTGDVACDHYRRFQDDVDLMHSLQLRAYRFSISWSRVLPQGTGRINPAGLGFYERLVDRLLARGIQPMATLYHWDLPAALDDRGGWLNPDIAQWFAEYADVVFRKLDDRVRLWTTFNEPWVAMNDGYLLGIHAPGHRSAFEATRVAHNLLVAHGKAVQTYRATGRNQIGLVVNIEPKYPASNDAADVAATRRADAYMNRQFLDPALLGAYPEELAEIFGEAWPRGQRARARNDPPAARLHRRQLLHAQRRAIRSERMAIAHGVRATGSSRTHTETGWEVFPQGLTDTLLWIKDRYGNPPIYITENGAAFLRSAERGRGGTGRPAARRLFAQAPARRARRNRPGRGHPRLSRVVAVRQPRMGVRVLQALRPGPRRLSNLAANTESQRPLLLPRDRARTARRSTIPVIERALRAGTRP